MELLAKMGDVVLTARRCLPELGGAEPERLRAIHLRQAIAGIGVKAAVSKPKRFGCLIFRVRCVPLQVRESRLTDSSASSCL